MKNPPYRIIIEQYGDRVMVETDHSDVDLVEFCDMLRRVCLAAGWSEGQVREIFNVTE